MAQIPLGFKVPVVVLEVALGILVGPHVLGLVRFEPFVAQMFTFAMAATLFMAGMELDFGDIKGRPLNLALSGWAISLGLAIAVVADPCIASRMWACSVLGHVDTMHDERRGACFLSSRTAATWRTPFGRMFIAAGTVGEVAPVIAMSLVLSQRYSTWQEIGFTSCIPRDRRYRDCRRHRRAAAPGTELPRAARCMQARSFPCAFPC